MSNPEMGPEGQSTDAAAVAAALEDTTPGRVANGIRLIQRAISIVCVMAGATGLMALAMAVWVWQDDVGALVITALVALVAVGTAIYVSRRTGALTRAAANPGQVLEQAKDLLKRATDSPELRRLAQMARRRGPSPEPGVGRLRRAISSGRMITAVIGLVGPDPKRHDLLIGFTPDRLHRLWLAVLVALGAWVIAGVLLTAASLTLIVRTL